MVAPGTGTPARTLLPALARIPGHLLWRAAARVGAAVDEVLPQGVDIHAYAALVALASEHASSQQWLADTVSVSRTTMTKVAAELAAQGLVERVRNPVDRRSYALRRTPAGARAARTWRRHAHAVEGVVLSTFSEAERAELQALLLSVARPMLAPHAPAELLASTAFLVTRVHARMHAEVMAALRDLDLEPRHLGSLVALGSSGPAPQAALARTLGTSAATVVEIVDHLERRGLVERRRLPTDRRTQVLHLVPGTEAAVEEAVARGRSVTTALLAPLSPAQRARLTDLLVRLITAA